MWKSGEMKRLKKKRADEAMEKKREDEKKAKKRADQAATE